jgi:prepilin-type N-terminal cleavage/methylation domain-containing protein
MMNHMRGLYHQQGFTLTEIMLVLTIFVLLTSLSLPSYSDLMSRYRLNAATVQVMSDLMLARKRALSQQHSVQVIFNSTQGYRIWDDRDDNNRMNRSEIHNQDVIPFGAQLESNNNPHFYPSGNVTNLATIRLRHPGVSTQKSRCITISITGRIKQSLCN